MCGIAGILMRSRPADWDRMRAALQQLQHRGPDGEGITGISFTREPTLSDGKNTRVLLGFRRLAILDLSHDADQPMRCSKTGNLLIFNGEIYNFIELKTELEQLGHYFTTSSDSEVLLAAYAQWGEAAFPRFNGMWALALYEAATGDTILSRDRMGVKPFYYACDGERFLFASEIRALTSLLGTQPALNPGAVFDFLAGGTIDHAATTLLDGIHALPAGALWRVTAEGDMQRGRYHAWPMPSAYMPAPEEIRDLLRDAVRLRLRADAPTVSLLSGGLDSSLITWLAAEENRHATRSNFVGAFSYGYTDERYAAHDEIARAQRLMQALPVPLTHRIVRMNPVPTLDELLAMTAAQELPIDTPSPIAGWRLYREIRAQGIKVALSGEGADEVFMGYTRRYFPRLALHYIKQRNWPALFTLLRSPQCENRALALHLAWYLPRPLLQQLLQQFRPHLSALNPAFRQRHRARFGDFVATRRQPLNELWRDDILRGNLPQILRYADRNSMDSGVELRLPFMDYRLVELALRTTPEAHLNAQGGKQALRHAFAGILPEPILSQPKTHGFGHAEQYQLLQCDLMPLLARAPAEAWDYLDRATLAVHLQRKQAHPLLWLPISFLLWMTVRHEQRR